MSRTAVAMLALALLSASASAQPGPGVPADSSAAPAPGAAVVPADLPVVSASVDTAATVIGGRVRLTVTVDAAEGWFVEPPVPASDLGGFRVRAVELATEAGGPRAYVLNLVAVESGDQEIPPIAVRARKGSGPPVDLVSPPVIVRVASNLEAAAGDSASAADPKPADLKPALDAPRDWRPVWIAAAAALIAFAAAFALLRRLRRRKPPEAAPVEVRRAPARPAWEIALEDLDRIAAERLVDRGELRRQYDEVTEALRRYVENRWGVPALESTTYDLRTLLDRVPISPATCSRLLALLSEADLVKFAKAIPEPDAARAAESRAREVVNESIPHEPAKEAAA